MRRPPGFALLPPVYESGSHWDGGYAGLCIDSGRALAIDRVLVSTDSERYAEIGRRYGAECPFLRSEAASSDASREEDILADLDARLLAHGVELADVWVWLKPTSPFRSVAKVQEGLEVLRTRGA